MNFLHRNDVNVMVSGDDPNDVLSLAYAASSGAIYRYVDTLIDLSMTVDATARNEKQIEVKSALANALYRLVQNALLEVDMDIALTIYRDANRLPSMNVSALRTLADDYFEMASCQINPRQTIDETGRKIRYVS